jgi:hypothetical protein
MEVESMLLLVMSASGAVSSVLMRQWGTEELSCQGSTLLQFQRQTSCGCMHAF